MSASQKRSKMSVTTKIAGLVFFRVDPSIEKAIATHLTDFYQIESIGSDDAFYSALETSSSSINAVLLGADINKPVNVAQRIHSIDKRLPVIILSNAAQCAQLRRDLMFSPFLGYEVLVWPTNDIDGLADVLADAAQRRHQRQRFHEASIANAHVRLEVLPLLQPEAAQYVEGLLDHQPIGVLATDTDGKIVTINVQARQLLNVTEKDALGTNIVRFFPTTERRRLKNLLSLALTSSTSLSPEVFEFPSQSGRPTYIEVTAATFSNSGDTGAMMLLQDVTLRVQSEKQHTEAVVELRLIATVLRAFHAISTAGGDRPIDRIRKFLKLGCEQFGMPIGIISRIEGSTFTVLESISNNKKFEPGNKLALDKTYCGSTVNCPDPIAFEHARLTKWQDHPTYKEQRYEAYMGVRIIVDGVVFGTLCYMSRAPRTHAFTAAERETLKLMSQWIASELQRERAEGHMRKLSSALEQTADSVIITDCEGVIEYVNPSFESLMGYNKDEVIGHPASFLQKDHQLETGMWEAIGRGTNYRFQHTSKTKEGRIFHEQMTISPLKTVNGNITHLISTGQDITALVEAKEKERERQVELTHVARLSTLGGMVSGLAHELNQPLCAIMTYAQTCLRKMETGSTDPDDLRHGLVQIVRQAERADEIFTRIRNFSRKRDMHRRRVDIREIIETTLSFVETDIQRTHVKLKTHFPKHTCFIYADTVQIQQVLLNIIRNSLDALADVPEEKRKITIRVTETSADQIRISLSDTGSGCPVEELHRLFEPFYTTKDAGLGVGLSISQAIVEAHEGKLWLDSTSSTGTTFCLTLASWKPLSKRKA